MIARIINGLGTRSRLWVFLVFGFIVTLVYLVVYKMIPHMDPNRVINTDFEVHLHNDDISKGHSIPKIIHQIWNDEVIPDQFVKHIQSIVKYNPHPEWEYFFWTHAIGREFIKVHYPKLERIFESSSKITKADILRTVVIYHYGGAYFDLDIVGVRPLDRFVENHQCALVGPIPEFFVALDLEIDYRAVNNAIFLCRAHHPFFKLLVKRTEERSIKCNESCTPEYPAPLLTELTDNGDTDIIPEVVNYKLFDPRYDMGIESRLIEKCSGDIYDTLEKAKQEICNNWKRHGKGDRKVDENSYTFHTWYHANARKFTVDSKNIISNIVPHVKMYNSLIRGHYGNIR